MIHSDKPPEALTTIESEDTPPIRTTQEGQDPLNPELTYQIYSWEQVEKSTMELAGMIRENEDLDNEDLRIVYPPRAGFFVAVILSQELGIAENKIIPWNINSYNGTQQTEVQNEGVPKELSELIESSNPRVLIVDEVIDTGKTANQIRHDLVVDCNFNNFSLWCLDIKSERIEYGDVFRHLEGHTRDVNGWIVYPWAWDFHNLPKRFRDYQDEIPHYLPHEHFCLDTLPNWITQGGIPLSECLKIKQEMGFRQHELPDPNDEFFIKRLEQNTLRISEENGNSLSRIKNLLHS